MPSKTYVNASISFVDPSLAGAALEDVARFYRPLMNLDDDQLTSCFFFRIGDGSGRMKLGVGYETLIGLNMRESIERRYHKPIGEFFPRGRQLKLIVVPDRVVAEGTVEDIVEVEGSAGDEGACRLQ